MPTGLLTIHTHGAGHPYAGHSSSCRVERPLGPTVLLLVTPVPARRRNLGLAGWGYGGA